MGSLLLAVRPSLALYRSAVDVFPTSLGGSRCVPANIVKDADANANPRGRRCSPLPRMATGVVHVDDDRRQWIPET